MKAVLSFVPRSWLAGSLLIALAATAAAMFVSPEPTPVDRLLQNAEAYLAKHPDKADAHYTLARIHYLAFHLKRDHVPAFRGREQEDKPPRIAPQWMVNGARPKKESKTLPEKDLTDHAAKALQGFNESLRLDPKNGLFQLGLASLEEEFAAWNNATKIAKLPLELSGITLAKVREAYAKALTLAMVEDSKLTELPLPGIGAIASHEAASALIRLAGGAGLSEAERKDVERAKKAVEHFASLRMGAVTPMVFSFQAAAHLDELLAPERAVDFDLRGYGPRERWPWVKPEVGFLVWDPECTGVIRSARQLFGGYTFQIFRANGYDALAALDDNGDGVLSGAELDGISVWFDRNGDGVSSPDEVTPLPDIGIVSIATTMDGHDGIHPTNARGIALRDGRTLRTWDWMVRPLSEKPDEPALALQR